MSNRPSPPSQMKGWKQGTDSVSLPSCGAVQGLQDEAMVVGKSAERPWERVGGVGWESSKPYTKPEKFPHLDSTSEHAPSAAEQMNDKVCSLF